MSSLQPSPGYNNNQSTPGVKDNPIAHYVLVGIVGVMGLIAVGGVFIILYKCAKSCWECCVSNRAAANPNREALAVQECAICLEGLVGGPAERDDYVAVVRACQHAFHLPCILKRTAWSRSCPVCRKFVDRLVFRSVAGEANRTGFAYSRGISVAVEIV